MNEQPEEKPKIIIDSDWKAQVEAEKEALRQREQAAQPSPSTSAGERPAAPESSHDEAMPPPTFSFLVTSLATQAMIALGQIADPIENKQVVRLPHARYHIDLLGMLEEKTQGNLLPEEKAILSHVLADLRMAYVTMENHAQPARAKPPG